jgi:hypothetical protein
MIDRQDFVAFDPFRSLDYNIGGCSNPNQLSAGYLFPTGLFYPAWEATTL